MIFLIQILRKHVMVRVGGGWDTLQHFLNKHDPCRHRAASDASIITKEGQGPMAAKVVYKRYMGHGERSYQTSHLTVTPPPLFDQFHKFSKKIRHPLKLCMNLIVIIDQVKNTEIT